jgi:peptide/nickel transport system substrate-binding protein
MQYIQFLLKPLTQGQGLCQFLAKLGLVENFLFIAMSGTSAHDVCATHNICLPGQKRSLKIRFSALFLICSSLLFSCGGDTEKNRSTILTYNEPQGLSTLDPALAGVSAPIQIGGQIFSGLVDLDTNRAIRPCLAKSWEVDSTGTEWTFHLRTDIYFHKDSCFGPPAYRRLMKADDIRYSFTRICDARTKTSGFWIFRDRVQGATEFHEATKAGKELAQGINGIKVLNDSVLRIKLIKPFAPFLSLLTMPYCSIIPMEAIQHYGADFGHHPVGTGPFMLESWQPDQQLMLARNPDYFRIDGQGKRLPYLEKVRITFIRDTKTEFVEYEQGKLDIILSIDPVFLPRILDEKGNHQPDFAKHHIIREESEDVVFCGIMLDSSANPATAELPLWKSRLLRQALNYAVDRQAICTYVLKGKGVPAFHGPLSPSMPGFSPQVKGYEYNPGKARELLAQAGYPDGKNLPELLLQSGNNATTIQAAEALQQQWQRLGIKTKLRQVNFPEHSAMMHAGKLSFWRGNWIADYPDPENVLALFYSPMASPKGLNDTRIRRRDLDSLYELALSPRLSAQKRYALYNQMEQIIIEEAPWVFLYYSVNYRLAQPSVIGFRPEVFGRLLLENVRLQGAN